MNERSLFLSIEPKSFQVTRSPAHSKLLSLSNQSTQEGEHTTATPPVLHEVISGHPIFRTCVHATFKTEQEFGGLIRQVDGNLFNRLH